MCACFFEKTDVVKSILESSEMKHIDLNVRDHHGNTSFMLACMSNRYNSVNAFLEYYESQNISINMNYQNRLGKTVFFIVAASKSKLSNPVLKLLLSYSERNKIEILPESLPQWLRANDTEPCVE